jgi:TPR repeat protein
MWYRQAAEQGDQIAQSNLGILASFLSAEELRDAKKRAAKLSEEIQAHDEEK